jgi:beta-phosphoglucomutase
VFVATLFDYNGVLVDDENVHLEAFRDVLAKLGVTFREKDYWERYIGFDDLGAFRAMLTDAGHEAPPALLSDLIAKKRPIYAERARVALRGFPGAAAVVARAAARGPVGIVSGALRDEIEMGLALLGIREQVGFIVSAEDTTESKPNPAGYELGYRELLRRAPSLARSETLVIEDSVAGVRAASAAGMTCLAILHSGAAEELGAAGARAVVPLIADVDDDFVRELYARTHA